MENAKVTNTMNNKVRICMIVVGWVAVTVTVTMVYIHEIMLIKFVLYAVRISDMQAKLEQPIAEGSSDGRQTIRKRSGYSAL